MIPHREEHLELCAGYALGNLDPAAAAELEAHLESGCAECESAIADFSSAAALVGASAKPAVLPAGLKARVMDEVRKTPQSVAADGVAPAEVTPKPAAAPRDDRPRVIEMPARRGWGFAEWGLAAAAAFLAVTTYFSWNAAQKLETQLGERQQQIAGLTQQLEEERRWAEVLAAPGAEAASFGLTPDGVKELKARAVYDPASRRAVLVFDHFTAPSGRDYELWALKGQGVASLGVIKVDANGHGVMRLENVGDPSELAGFAVSLEPAGGSPTPNAPTGPVVMAAKFGG